MMLLLAPTFCICAPIPPTGTIAPTTPTTGTYSAIIADLLSVYASIFEAVVRASDNDTLDLQV